MLQCPVPINMGTHILHAKERDYHENNLGHKR